LATILFIANDLLVFFCDRFLNDTEIAKAQRDFELKKAAYDVEVQTKVGFDMNISLSQENVLAV
jgi:hypothetical protein